MSDQPPDNQGGEQAPPPAPPAQPAASAKNLIPVSQGYSMAPQNLGELMTFANMLAASDLVPKDYKGKPGNVMVAMQMGHEIGLQPMQAIQNIAVINGKPAIYGDLGKALLRAKGCDIEEADAEEIRKTGIAWCIITRHGQKPVKRTFSIDDAKTAKLLGKEGPWSTYPQRQMAWRAFWFAARDSAPDILKGIMGREEVEDYPDVRIEKVEEKKENLAELMPKRASDSTANKLQESAKKPPEGETKHAQSETDPAQDAKKETISETQLKEIFSLSQGMKLPPQEVQSYCKMAFKVEVRQLPAENVEELKKWIRTQKPGA